ncbi:MAG TPA: hypothetical protein PKL15_10280 [Saprospiraceae bacterium]|nr:hypothetical protein [Saprospiraceae bacterium]
MTIRIQPEMTVAEVCDSFHSAYPYLKLEFFSVSHRAFQGSLAQYMIKDHSTRLSALNAGIAEGDLDCRPEVTVRVLEDNMERQFGLHIQVFRLSHDLWLVSSATDNLTLFEQNRRGKSSEHPTSFESEQPMDYREQD